MVRIGRATAGITATAIVVACATAAQADGPQRRRLQSPPPTGEPSTVALQQQAILMAEDSRLALPEGLHTPEIDTLRARAADDLRLLIGLARASDAAVQPQAIRALGRLERRELVPLLLPFLMSGPRGEAATAIGQSFRGDPLPQDASGETAQAALDALIQAGAIETGDALGPIARAIGRLPYATAPQVQAADAFLLDAMHRVDPDPKLRPLLIPITRAIEALGRTQSRLAPLGSETADALRRIVTELRHPNPPDARINAMAALVGAGLDEETLRFAASASLPGLRRLAALALGGSGSVVVASERTSLLTTLLKDSSPVVRIEAVRSWVKQETAAAFGCLRLLDAFKDPNLAVSLAAVDVLADHCRDEVSVTDRLTWEARTPPVNDWHLASHALVALAKRAPARTVIPLLGSHISHPTWQVRMYAAWAASSANEVSALERLAMDQNDNVREASLPGLRRLKGDEAEPYFVWALGRSDYQLLRTAANEAKGMKPTAALAAGLADALRRVTAERKETSRDTRVALLERLRELGRADQAGALMPLLMDYDIPVAVLASELLQTWTGKPQEIAPRLLPRPLPNQGEIAEARSAPGRIKLASGRTIRFTLMPSVAPLTSVRFLRLARSGYFNGLTFHRVVPNFVVQGGSPGANEYAGDSLYLRDEIGEAAHVPGAIGLSTRGRDTGDAQFFVDLVDIPRLDFDYTVFGQVDPTTMDVLETIAEGDRIVEITFKDEDEKASSSHDGGLEHAYRARVGVRLDLDPFSQRPLRHAMPDHRP